MVSCLNVWRGGFHLCSQRVERRLVFQRWLKISKLVSSHHSKVVTSANTPNPRVNEINIQMLPWNLHEQIFPKTDKKGISTESFIKLQVIC